MNATTVAIGLAKDVFELAYADSSARSVQRRRLSRARLAAGFRNLVPRSVVMEACSSAHYWARRLAAKGHRPLLLPGQHAKLFVRGSKTDRSDAAGLLTAPALGEIRALPIKAAEQQGLQGRHRVRERHKHQRMATINVVRGLLREFGVAIPGPAPHSARRCPGCA
jgi:transposase